MTGYIGEISAFGTAVTWSISAVLFTIASRKLGSFSMSHYRMVFGMILVYIACALFEGDWLPIRSLGHDQIMLLFSGVFGFFLCDVLLFQSYVDIGPRLGALLFCTYPFVSALLAWIFLGEVMPLNAWLGMMVAFMGILIVVMDKKGRRTDLHPHHFYRGMMLALGASAFQGVSFILAKPAMEGAAPVTPLAATFIRGIAGGSLYFIVSLFRGRLGDVLKKIEHKKEIGLIACGAVLGPSLGVWLSMMAIKHAPIGIASTIMALLPVTIIPFSMIAFKEKFTIQALVGAIIAFIGTALLFNAN